MAIRGIALSSHCRRVRRRAKTVPRRRWHWARLAITLQRSPVGGPWRRLPWRAHQGRRTSRPASVRQRAHCQSLRNYLAAQARSGRTRAEREASSSESEIRQVLAGRKPIPSLVPNTPALARRTLTANSSVFAETGKSTSGKHRVRKRYAERQLERSRSILSVDAMAARQREITEAGRSRLPRHPQERSAYRPYARSTRRRGIGTDRPGW